MCIPFEAIYFQDSDAFVVYPTLKRRLYVGRRFPTLWLYGCLLDDSWSDEGCSSSSLPGLLPPSVETYWSIAGRLVYIDVGLAFNLGIGSDRPQSCNADLDRVCSFWSELFSWLRLSIEENARVSASTHLLFTLSEYSQIVYLDRFIPRWGDGFVLAQHFPLCADMAVDSLAADRQWIYPALRCWQQQAGSLRNATSKAGP